MPKKGYKMPEWRKLEISSRMKGKPKSESHKKSIKLSENSGRIKPGQRISPNTEFKKGQIGIRKGVKKTEEDINKQKETIKNKTEEQKKIVSENVSNAAKGKHNSLYTEFKSCHIPWNKGLIKETDERVRKLSEKQKETKKNPEVLKRILGFPKPNYSEISLLDILNKIYPNEWKFVGNGSFVINGKNPDFINCNGKKLIIELFGEHWHDKDEEEPRKEIFKQYGYETLIIWTKELRHLEILINKLNSFMENK